MSKRSAKRSNTDRDRESIPLESDWGDYHDDMEMAFAHRRFAGKQRSETLSYFDAPLLVSEDLESMPDIPFISGPGTLPVTPMRQAVSCISSGAS